MKGEWKWNGSLNTTLKDFTTKLETWNKYTFGNVFQRKKRNLMRLEGVQRSLKSKLSERMFKLERKLKMERMELLLQGEILWLQKSRNEWLKYGDGNTKFFHMSTLIRRKQNRIESLKDEQGNWVDDKETLKNLATTFYKTLFTSDASTGGDFLRGCFPPLSEDTRRRLEEDYSIEETCKALMEMGSLKAPGPDGYPPLFFKATWDTTGKDLHQFVQGILNGVEIPLNVAEALLVLIPKEERPSTIRGFRPISRCNVSLKVASKMIVNRWKSFMGEIISSSQAAFIPGRQSIDNIVICQEVVHSLKFTKARRGGMVMKLDLEKAYDKLEWPFIEDTLREASIPEKMIRVIMQMLQQTTCRLLWNGEATDVIRPSRGLRQGDPLSPYIFTYVWSV